MRPHDKGTSEFKRFDAAIQQILSVSRDELKRREAEWKKQRKAKRQANAKKRP